MIKMPLTTRFLVSTVLINVFFFFIMRVIFFYANNIPNDDSLVKSFHIGLKFDVRLALLVNLPVVILCCIRLFNPLKSRFGKIFWAFYLACINTIILIFYLIDFGHYKYLEQRLNASIMEFMYNPVISTQMVWQTYPVIWAVIGIFLFGTGYYYLVNFLIKRLTATKDHTPRIYKVVAFLCVIIIFALGIYGKFSYYPLRWSDAFFSSKESISQFTLNPIIYFFDTFKYKNKDYNIEKTKKYYDIISLYLGVSDQGKEKLQFKRFTDNRKNTNKPNIVIVILESFVYYKTGLSGNILNPTPNLDKIAKNSLLFNRFYVPSSGTARSVFALMTGIPDVNSINTSSRNPLSVQQNLLINNFQGYEKFYFLGGSLNWANIRGFLSHNIPDLKIYEEGSYTSKRMDVWGISDIHLFEESNIVLKDLNKPFIAIIQTSGNHRPYTIPDDNKGFKQINIDEDKLKKYGFSSNKEFNSFRFMDHSIGFFIKTAMKEKYFDNTMFIFLGDHGLPTNAEHIPKIEKELSLPRYHVPLIIYAPLFIHKGKILNKISSEIDIFATVASLAGISYINTTLGRDLLDKRFDSIRYAFTIEGQTTNPLIGLVDKDFYFSMKPDRTEKRLYSLNSTSTLMDIQDRFVKKFYEMEKICSAIYENARYLLYNNH